MGFGKIFTRLWGEVINAKLGLLSFTTNFLIVFWVNHEHGLVLALITGFKDGLAKFFLGGFFGRLTERFSEIRSPFLAYPLGSIIPTCLAYVLYFTMHATTGTPEPIMSTLVPMAVSMFINTPTTIFILRRGYFRQNTSKPAVKDRVWTKRQAARAARAEAAAQDTKRNNKSAGD